MKKVLKWVGLLIGGLLAVLVLAVGTVYIIVGHKLSEVHEIAGTDLPVPTTAADVAEGERLARIRGCNGGCHGREGATGALFFELPDGSKVVTPDLHRLAADYSIAELEGAIRHGVKPDGTTVLGIMPSEMFYHLTDHQLGQIIAYLRSQPPGNERLPEAWFGPMLRSMMFYFQQVEDWDSYAVLAIDHDAPRLPYDPADPVTFGRYLAMTSCTECHGKDLKGESDGSTPDLAIAAAYSTEAFFHLMRTGEPFGGRKLDLMELVAQKRFANFTDPEIAALFAYLRNRAGLDAAAVGVP